MPHSQSIGIDVVAIPRIERLLCRYGERAKERFLSPKECELAKSPKTVAGFWAAKEACSKALGVGIFTEKLSFADMQISKTPLGAPIISLSNNAREIFGNYQLTLSITHDYNLAIAVVLAYKNK